MSSETMLSDNEIGYLIKWRNDSHVVDLIKSSSPQLLNKLYKTKDEFKPVFSIIKQVEEFYDYEPEPDLPSWSEINQNVLESEEKEWLDDPEKYEANYGDESELSYRDYDEEQDLE